MGERTIIAELREKQKSIDALFAQQEKISGFPFNEAERFVRSTTDDAAAEVVETVAELTGVKPTYALQLRHTVLSWETAAAVAVGGYVLAQTLTSTNPSVIAAGFTGVALTVGAAALRSAQKKTACIEYNDTSRTHIILPTGLTDVMFRVLYTEAIGRKFAKTSGQGERSSPQAHAYGLMLAEDAAVHYDANARKQNKLPLHRETVAHKIIQYTGRAIHALEHGEPQTNMEQTGLVYLWLRLQTPSTAQKQQLVIPPIQ